MAYSGPLQVVPDIDDEDNDSRPTSTSSTNTSSSSSSCSSSNNSEHDVAPGLSDLEKKLLHLQSDMLTEAPKVLTVARRRRELTPTSVTRLNVDAQRLSAAEMHWYRHLAELRTTQ